MGLFGKTNSRLYYAFLENYAWLELLNDLASEKFDSDLHNDDIYSFFVHLDD